jgi:hypothetical protein
MKMIYRKLPKTASLTVTGSQFHLLRHYEKHKVTQVLPLRVVRLSCLACPNEHLNNVITASHSGANYRVLSVALGGLQIHTDSIGTRVVFAAFFPVFSVFFYN